MFEGDEAEIREYHEENLRDVRRRAHLLRRGQRGVAAAQAARAAEGRRLRPHQAAAGRRDLPRRRRGHRRRSASARTRRSSSRSGTACATDAAAAVRRAAEGRPVLFNPFPGLRPFEPDEDHLFFGREKEIDELLRRLRSTRFLAVVGTSGSGKSSLVRSGLIPSLQSGFIVGAGSSWRMAVMRPGEDPIGHLAAALAPRRPRARRRRTRGQQPRAAGGHAPARPARARRRGPPGAPARGSQRARRRRSVRGAVPVPPQRAHRELARRGDRVRQAAARSRPAAGSADLRRADDAVGFHRRLHGLPGAARGRQRGPVPGAAMARDELRSAITGPGRGRRRGDRAAARAAGAERPRRRSRSAPARAARADAHVGSLGRDARPAASRSTSRTTRRSARSPARSRRTPRRRTPKRPRRARRARGATSSRRSPTRFSDPRGVRRPTSVAELAAICRGAGSRRHRGRRDLPASGPQLPDAARGACR